MGAIPKPRKHARETFFKLLLAGYASGVTPKRIPRFEGDPGTKRNVWQDLYGWTGIDEWRTTGIGDGSNGTTSIYYKNCLVWEMQYGGSYPKEAVPFLRQALRINYRQRIWHGGRGPDLLEGKTFRYRNELEGKNDFGEFGGVEYVDRKTNGGWITVGRHFYRGGFLFV